MLALVGASLSIQSTLSDVQLLCRLPWSAVLAPLGPGRNPTGGPLSARFHIGLEATATELSFTPQ